MDAKDKALNVFPNPMNDILTIWTREIHPDTLHQVRVLGISGELVLHTTLLNRETNLDLSHLPEGWYILQIRKGKEEMTQRIMKTSGP
ncbi:MAG: T9SS type A sorting domain-containing protein [Saprospiraceae bacterium]